MQQFGFSATDVKLKQWDETKNWQQRKHSAPRRYPLARRCLPNYPKASSLSQKPCPNSRVKTHPLGKIAASLKPFPKVGKYQPGMDAHAFGRKSGFVGALGRAISSRGKDWC